MKSTIDGIEGMDTVNIEDIPTDKLNNIVEHLNKTIEKAQKERWTVLYELMRRGEKVFWIK